MSEEVVRAGWAEKTGWVERERENENMRVRKTAGLAGARLFGSET